MALRGGRGRAAAAAGVPLGEAVPRRFSYRRSSGPPRRPVGGRRGGTCRAVTGPTGREPSGAAAAEGVTPDEAVPPRFSYRRG
ncbi:hypothetical protein AB0D45_34600, partial [Streptomyces sp. NPDC048352]|uniref:hypothetical protein n=1 Tax=Streptomyces sp. NPDC048352 TaxID=3154718 RepID=UPI00342C8AF8